MNKYWKKKQGKEKGEELKEQNKKEEGKVYKDISKERVEMVNVNGVIYINGLYWMREVEYRRMSEEGLLNGVQKSVVEGEKGAVRFGL